MLCLIRFSMIFCSILACFQVSGCKSYPDFADPGRYKAESFDFGNGGKMVMVVNKNSLFTVAQVSEIVKDSLEKREITYSSISAFTYRDNAPLQISQEKNIIFEFVLNPDGNLHFGFYCERTTEQGKVESSVFFAPPFPLSDGNRRELRDGVDSVLDQAFARLSKCDFVL